jgi:hypothetical protein
MFQVQSFTKGRQVIQGRKAVGRVIQPTPLLFEPENASFAIPKNAMEYGFILISNTASYAATYSGLC